MLTFLFSPIQTTILGIDFEYPEHFQMISTKICTFVDLFKIMKLNENLVAREITKAI